MYLIGFIIRIYHDARSCQMITDGFTSISTGVRYAVLPSLSHAFSSLPDLAVTNIPELPQDTVQTIVLSNSA